ncbi:MAG TPA: zinc-dependent metalloprotease [Gemmatimonadaceae bacterium]|nr:zinc-dependent metalloprotease [Gemmatimonadaceae bacterium]
MPRSTRRLHVFLAIALMAVAPARHALAQGGADAPFIGVRVDQDRNKVLLEITPERLGKDFLHQSVLATGAGVPALGLDRGQTGASVVVRLERRGKRVVMVRDNYQARALGADPAGQRGAAEAFPTTVVAAFPIESEANGVLVADATALFLSDTYGIAESIRRSQQGNGRVDANRSWIDPSRTRAFPRNTEIHAVLTFAVDNPGFALRRAAPDAASPTFEVHHSLVALPDTQGFRPRQADSRAGLFGQQFNDFGQGLDGTYRAGYAARWRLVPKDPAAYLRGQLTEPVQPIVYYLDPAIPEPYRSAFREGGMWWNKVFEGAGWKNAFQVRDLPAGADPMDARYNMIYWVHRNLPGPSVGPSLGDPRTGEILRTVVRMDAWRSLVDYNIYAGLVPAAGPSGLNVSAEDFAMMRRRQHVAHEIGHTLGMSHNYIAHTQGRSSVMDYPFPLITVDARGTLDLRQAYAPFAGAWDSLAIRYGHTWYPDAASERAGLAKIIKEMLDRDVRFVADQDADATGSIPEVTRWVEGKTMFDAVERTSTVRRIAIDKFDERALEPGEPMYLLNMRFAHVYLHHRYSLEGLVKYVGGMDYRYAMRGDGQAPTTILPAESQRRALRMALDALEPAELQVPERVMRLIPPVPYGGDQSFEWIGSAGGPAFDQISLAGGLATEVIEGVLHRERLARVAQFAARDRGLPTLDEVLKTVVDRTWGAAPDGEPAAQVLRRTVQRVVLNTLLDRAGDKQALAEVRQAAEWQLQQLDARMAAMSGGSVGDQALRASARREIARYFAGEDDPAARSRFAVIPLPWP